MKTIKLVCVIFVLILLVFATNTHGQVTINSTNYSTLKAGFDAINAGTHTGNIVITLSSSTTETATASLNASGSGSASYSSVLIYPTASGVTIGGTLAAALITFYGADNVTFDGRVNQSGSMNLIVQNLSTSSSASTFTFNNDACNNTLTYIDVKGSPATINNNPSNSSRGIIYFGDTSPSTGSDNNTVSYCNIGPAGSNLPGHGVFSYGSTTGGRENSGNTINHCDIFDYFYDYTAGSSQNTFDAGVYLAYYGNTGWTITNNSFYQTASRNKSNNNQYNNISAIYIASGDGYNISGNYIGGQSSQCGGSAMTYTGNAFEFIPIKVRSGMLGTSNIWQVNNNTIKNISFSSGSTYQCTNDATPRFSAFHFGQGKISCSGNTIGSTTENNSIILQQTNGTFTLYYIWEPVAYSNYNVILEKCNRNTIAGVTTDATYYDTQGFHFEYYTANAFDSICYNLVGSTTQAQSIQISLNTASVTRNNFVGIFISSLAVGSRIITNNVVANVVRGSGTSDGMTLISSSTPDAMIKNNSVYNIETNNTGTVYGLSVSGTNATVERNYIARIGSPTSSGSNVIGLYNGASGGGADFYNNIIILGKDRSGNSYLTRPFYGIYNIYGENICFNTVYIDGSCTSYNSSAYYESSNSATRVIKNNIFSNARSNTSGSAKHYAAYFTGTSGLTVDNNDYYISGTGGVLAYLSSDKATLAALQGATLQDASSLNTNPSFINPSGIYAPDFKPTTTLNGSTLAAVTTDFAGAPRAVTPTVGALEYGVNKWVGSVSSDFGTASNWSKNYVPIDGENIEFDAFPSNHCVLDINRSLGSITNAQGTYELRTNGKRLSIAGVLTFSNSAKINATSTGSEIEFCGTSAQTVPFESFNSNYIKTLRVNNSAGITLQTDLVIGTQLVFLNGIVNSLFNNLEIADDATVTGAGTGKYINGNCIKTGNDAFVFPLGNNGKYAAIGISAPSNVGDQFTARYYKVNPNALYNISYRDASLDVVSINGYWILNRTTGTSNVAVTLYWDNSIGVSVLSDMRVARWNGSLWTSEGNASTTGNATAGSVTSNTVTSFSPFTFGSIGSGNSLPVELISFSAHRDDKNAVIEWTTASEINNDYFVVEKSFDGTEWTVVTVVDGAGNSTQLLNYSVNDKYNNEETVYYRLLQVDFDGTGKYSEVVRLERKEGAVITVYPNPATSDLSISGLNETDMYRIRFFDMLGAVLAEYLANGLELKNIDLSVLKNGMYNIEITNPGFHFNTLIFKK